MRIKGEMLQRAAWNRGSKSIAQDNQGKKEGSRQGEKREQISQERTERKTSMMRMFSRDPEVMERRACACDLAIREIDVAADAVVVAPDFYVLHFAG